MHKATRAPSIVRKQDKGEIQDVAEGRVFRKPWVLNLKAWGLSRPKKIAYQTCPLLGSMQLRGVKVKLRRQREMEIDFIIVYWMCPFGWVCCWSGSLRFSPSPKGHRFEYCGWHSNYVTNGPMKRTFKSNCLWTREHQLIHSVTPKLDPTWTYICVSYGE